MKFFIYYAYTFDIIVILSQVKVVHSFNFKVVVILLQGDKGYGSLSGMGKQLRRYFSSEITSKSCHS